MPRRKEALFDGIASFPALRAATLRAARGKRRSRCAARFPAGLERNFLRLEDDLTTRRWRPGPYTVMQVRDPKPRRISAAPFRDRVVHYALCAVVKPIFERGFMFDSYANRKAKGIHAGIARYELFRDRHRYVLHCDVFRCFPSIDHEILKRDLRRRIACPDTLWLLDSIVVGSNRNRNGPDNRNRNIGIRLASTLSPPWPEPMGPRPCREHQRKRPGPVMMSEGPRGFWSSDDPRGNSKISFSFSPPKLQPHSEVFSAAPPPICARKYPCSSTVSPAVSGTMVCSQIAVASETWAAVLSPKEPRISVVPSKTSRPRIRAEVLELTL